MGIDLGQVFFIPTLKALKWVVINLWYWWIILALFIAVKIFLAKKLVIFTMDDLAYFVISLFSKGTKPTIQYLCKDTFQKDFIWITPTEFVFD